jgi:hypothetical protein
MLRHEMHLYFCPWGIMVGMVGLGLFSLPTHPRIHSFFTNMAFASLYMWFLTNDKTFNRAIPLGMCVFLVNFAIKASLFTLNYGHMYPQLADKCVQWTNLVVLLVSYWRVLDYTASRYVHKQQ